MSYVKTIWVDNTGPPGIDAEHLNKIEAGIYDVSIESNNNVADITTLDGRLGIAETNIGTLQTNIGVTQDDITALDGRLDIAETNIVVSQGDITTLDGRLDTVETSLGVVQTNIGVAQDDITTLDSRLDVSQSDIIWIDGRLDTVETSLGAAQNNITSLDGRVDNLELMGGGTPGGVEEFTYDNIIDNFDMNYGRELLLPTTTNITDPSILIDRFPVMLNAAGTYTIERGEEYNMGYPFYYFANITNTTSATLSSGSFSYITQKFNSLFGFNSTFLKSGTASARSFGISFYVKSSVVGTYIFEIYDVTTTTGISHAYTIDTVDTWELKEFVIPGCTSTLLRNLMFRWWLSAGSDFNSGTLNTDWGIPAFNNATGQVGHHTIGDNFALAYPQINVAGDTTRYNNKTPRETQLICQKFYRRDSIILTGTVIISGLIYSSTAYFPEMCGSPNITSTGATCSGATLVSYYVSSSSTYSFSLSLTVTGGTVGHSSYIACPYEAVVDEISDTF